MLQPTPLLSQCTTMFSTNNSPVMNNFGRLETREPYRTPSGYTPLQPVKNYYGSNVISSAGQLYTNGIKIGTDRNYIMNQVRLPEIDFNMHKKKEYDYHLPILDALTAKTPKYGGYYSDSLTDKFSYDPSCPTCGKRYGHESWCKFNF